MTRRPKGSPRKIGGGRSDRYESRREERGVERQRTQEWSDAAASAALRALREAAVNAGKSLGRTLLLLVKSRDGWQRWVHRTGTHLCEYDRALATTLLEEKRAICSALIASGDGAKASRVLRSLKEVLRRRATACTRVTQMEVPTVTTETPPSFHSWLSSDPSKDKTRDIRKSKRIWDGLRRWPFAWLERPGVLCFERAVSRAKQKEPTRGGVPSEAAARSLVSTVLSMKWMTLRPASSSGYVE